MKRSYISVGHVCSVGQVCVYIAIIVYLNTSNVLNSLNYVSQRAKNISLTHQRHILTPTARRAVRSTALIMPKKTRMLGRPQEMLLSRASRKKCESERKNHIEIVYRSYACGIYTFFHYSEISSFIIYTPVRRSCMISSFLCFFVENMIFLHQIQQNVLNN